MDESTLQDRLDRIERRQYLVIVLLVVPYLLGIGEFVGYWIAGIAGVGVALVGFAVVVYDRRRNPNGVDG